MHCGARAIRVFRCSRCLGRARTLVAPTLLAYARSVAAPSQALKNAPLCRVFSPRHPRTPSHAKLCEGGLRPQKPSPTANAAKAIRTRTSQGCISGLARVADAAPRSRRVFLARRAPGTHQRCRGCGGGRAMNAARRARCLALAANRDPAQPKRSVAERRRSRCPCSRGASAARTVEHLKNPE